MANTYTGGTFFSYGGIPIDFIQSQSLSEQTIYDDTDTDYIYTKITISIKGMIYHSLLPSNPGETPAQTLVRIRKTLRTPRLQLLYKVGPDNVYSSPLTGQVEDANHGPKPRQVEVTAVNGTVGGNFMVSLSIDTYIYECTKGTQNPFSSNRWKEQHTIDEHGYTTRSVNGVIVFRSNAIDGKTLTQGQGADHYRSLIIPPNLHYLPNFRRTHQEFYVSEDGLRLGYTIVDKQEYVMPPTGLTKFEATHVIANKRFLTNYEEQITVRGWGPSTMPKQQVYLACATIALARLQGQIVMEATWTDHVEQNYVELKIQMYMQPATKQQIMGRLVVPFATVPNKLSGIGGDFGTGQPPAIGLRGTQGLYCFQLAQYLQQCANSSATEKAGN